MTARHREKDREQMIREIAMSENTQWRVLTACSMDCFARVWISPCKLQLLGARVSTVWSPGLLSKLLLFLHASRAPIASISSSTPPHIHSNCSTQSSVSAWCGSMCAEWQPRGELCEVYTARGAVSMGSASPTASGSPGSLSCDWAAMHLLA